MSYNREQMRDQNGRWTLGSGASAFMDKLKASTSAHPFDRRTRLDGEVGLQVSKVGDKAVALEAIINYGDRGKGNASRALTRLASIADKTGTSISLTVSPLRTSQKGLSASALTKWYKGHGYSGKFGEFTRAPKGGK
jgi:hypothetical protein